MRAAAAPVTLRGLAGLGLAGLLAAAGCVPPPSHQERDLTTDANLVSNLLVTFAADVAHGRVAAVLGALTPEFKLQGDGLAEVEEWTRFWQTMPGVVKAEVSDVDLELSAADDPAARAAEGTKTTVAYTLAIASCATAETAFGDCTALFSKRAFPGAPQAWLSHLVRTSGGWRGTGDGERVGLALTSRHDGAAYVLDVAVRDPARLLVSATLSGPGIEGGVPLAKGSGGLWTPATPPVLSSDPVHVPSPPIRYRLDGATASGTLTGTGAVLGLVDEFAVPTAPLGEVPAPIVFRWDAPGALPRRFQVSVEHLGATVWTSAVITAHAIAWGGPTLIPGDAYDYRVLTLDTHGNSSVAHGSFVPLAAGALTPVLSTLTPAVGVAGGGTVVEVRGVNFVSGAKVMFGEGDATDVQVVDAGLIRCKTPPHVPGAVNVLVINPTDRIGLLARAFTYQ